MSSINKLHRMSTSAYGKLGIGFFIGSNRPSGGYYFNDIVTTMQYNLIPAEPLIAPVFEYSPTTTTVNGWHGTFESSMPYYTSNNLEYGCSYTQNATGSWDFYYVLDEQVHSPWDDCGTIWGLDIKNEYDDAYDCRGNLQEYGDSKEIKTNYPYNHKYSWTMANDLHGLISAIQGRRLYAVLIYDWDDNNDKSACIESYEYYGRFWVSKVSCASDGLTTVTISYDVTPGSYKGASERWCTLYGY